MTKYIVKNCPARKPMITVDGKHGGKTMFDVCSEGKYTPCQDRTDCPIKQVVEMCKDAIDNNPCINCPDRGVECWQCDHEYEYKAGNPELEIPKKILQTLQVQEVE